MRPVLQRTQNASDSCIGTVMHWDGHRIHVGRIDEGALRDVDERVGLSVYI